MSDKDLILTLGKVVIAAAWVDGEISMEEVNCLKDLLFHMPHVGNEREMQMTAQEWARLEIYVESPVGEAERARLVEELRTTLRDANDRDLVLSALDTLIQADGVVTDEELAVVEEVKQAFDDVNLGLIGQLGRLIQGPMERRSEIISHAPNREEFFEAYVRNKVYYKVRQQLQMSEADFSVSDAELRKLSLAGGLMARVAHVDQVVTNDEVSTMVEALQAGWDLLPEDAALVAEVAVSEVGADLDYYRLVREFFTSTTKEERIDFLGTLFAVAAADGEVSSQESLEIRHIGRDLNLTQQQFLEARAKVVS